MMISYCYKYFLIIGVSILILNNCSTASKLGSDQKVDQEKIQDVDSGGDNINQKMKMNQGVKYNSTRSNRESNKKPENNKGKDDKKDDK